MSWAVAGGPIDQVSDMGDAKLLKTVERWLRTERTATRNADQSISEKNSSSSDSVSAQQEKPATKPAPYFPSRHMAYFH